MIVSRQLYSFVAAAIAAVFLMSASGGHLGGESN
jgi:hypothetical protein